MIKLLWNNDQNKIEITDEHISVIENCITAVLTEESINYSAEISLTITDDNGIREINAAVRGIDKETDVLSFPMLDSDESGSIIIDDEDFDNGFLIVGDIVISAERAAFQAREYGHAFLREIGFLTVHSMLHLLGYDHEKNEESERLMFDKQEHILKKVNLTR